MKNLTEIYEDHYLSKRTFNASDEKDFEFQIIVRVYNMMDACGEPGYSITVEAAKLPKYLTRKQVKQVAEFMCIKTKEVSSFEIAEYGISAPLYDVHVNTEDEIEKELERIDNQILAYGGLIGFYLDKQVNRIGNTGWDFIKGQIG